MLPKPLIALRNLRIDVSQRTRAPVSKCNRSGSKPRRTHAIPSISESLLVAAALCPRWNVRMSIISLSDVATGAGHQTVTASELVRQFGIWQDRAAQAPVYILNRGRPRLMLATVDLMNALCAPRGPGTTPDMLALLLGAMDELVVLIGPERTIVAASTGARGHFGAAVMPGGPATALGDEASRPLLAAALRRVAQTGLSEIVEFPSPSRPGRVLSGLLRPLDDHVLMAVRDHTLTEELRDAEALSDAQAAAASSAGVAVVTINLRGYVEEPSIALARLSGLPVETLATARFVSLLELAHRPATGELIEAVIRDGTARAIDAALLVNRGDPVPIRIGLSAVRQNLTVRAVCAMIAPSVPNTAKRA
jgi:PAS domain-containing protein